MRFHIRRFNNLSTLDLLKNLGHIYQSKVLQLFIDLYSPYRPLINELFPNAIIIADHFHVVVQAFQALNSVRLQVMRQTGSGSHDWRAPKR